MIEVFTNFQQVPNTWGELRCTQSIHAMMVEALTGERMSLSEADEATGYVEGRETWPYTQLSWLTQHGFQVRVFDDLDAEAFAVRPIETLKSTGLEQSTLDYFISITDFDRESTAIREAIDGGAEFIAGVPDPLEIINGLADCWFPLVSLDLGILNGTSNDGFQGHVVAATGYQAGNGNQIRLQDPGPPAFWNRDVGLGLVGSAMKSPTESSGTITLVRLKA